MSSPVTTEMTPTPPKRLFVSYSRKNGRGVHETVRLLRATGAPVFVDIDNIPLGNNWRVALNSALKHADAVLVFWSEHAATSTEVATELDLAIQLGKPVIPVLLDGTPMPDVLSHYQGVNLQELFLPHDPAYDPSPLIEQIVRQALALR